MHVGDIVICTKSGIKKYDNIFFKLNETATVIDIGRRTMTNERYIRVDCGDKTGIFIKGGDIQHFVSKEENRDNKINEIFKHK